MSLRPGIGAGFMVNVSQQKVVLENMDDVPLALRHGSREKPLGRYLRRRLREEIGRGPEAPEIVLQTMAAEMLPLRLAARSDDARPSLKSHVLDSNEGKRANHSARVALFKKGRSL